MSNKLQSAYKTWSGWFIALTLFGLLASASVGESKNFKARLGDLFTSLFTCFFICFTGTEGRMEIEDEGRVVKRQTVTENCVRRKRHGRNMIKQLLLCFSHKVCFLLGFSFNSQYFSILTRPKQTSNAQFLWNCI